MRGWAAAPLILALCAAPALGREKPPARSPYADPSAVIAAESAMARLAREKGLWAALRAMAAPDALAAAPQLLPAQRWLKTRAKAGPALTWQTHAVWSSCDGSLAVSHGAWQGSRQDGGAFGAFTSIWQRQADGAWKWLFRQRNATAQPLAEPEMLPALVADCPERKPGAAPESSPPARATATARDPLGPNPLEHADKAADGSLWWRVTIRPDGTHTLAAGRIKAGQETPILTEEAPGEGN